MDERTSIRRNKASISTVDDLIPRFGISRVTDITKLDSIGLPVFSAIRPNAVEGTLCVSSGKAYSKSAARVGAICEAIELASAEPNFASLISEDILFFDSDNDLGLMKFSPLYPFAFRPKNEAIAIRSVRAIDIVCSETKWVPEQLVLFPVVYQNSPNIFGSSTNGLCSGGDLNEAVLHGLFELIERDALSFVNAGAPQYLISSLVRHVPQWLNMSLEKSGSKLLVTYISAVCGFPTFIAYLFDEHGHSGISVARGQGTHAIKEIALNRAITEAIQSRLTNIQGGRDDIVSRFQRFDSEASEMAAVHRLKSTLRNSKKVSFDEIESAPVPSVHVDSMLEKVLALLRDAGFDEVLVTKLFGDENDPIVVARVIVPGLEYLSPKQPRIGLRILKYRKSIAK